MKRTIIALAMMLAGCKELSKPSHAEINNMLLDILIEKQICLGGELSSLHNDSMYDYWDKRYRITVVKFDSISKLYQ